MTLYPRHVGTIGSAIALDVSMTIYCSRRIEGIVCGHNATVDLLALRDRYGDEFRVADFVARSVCAKCGGRWPDLSIRISPNHTGPEWARPNNKKAPPA